MSRYYKCDLCGAPYAPTRFMLTTDTTAYIETGIKDFNGNASNASIRDVCPDCNNKILDFMNSLKPEEVEEG